MIPKWILSKKTILIAVAALLVLTATTIAVFVLRQSDDTDNGYELTGRAEAVLTTKLVVEDAVWHPQRYSDELYNPIGITMLNGNLVIADSMCDRIVVVDGETNKRIGRPGQYGIAYIDSGALVDGYRESSLFMKPSGVAAAPNGNIIISDTGNHAIRLMDDTYVITIAGNGFSGYANGFETDAQFNYPRAAAVAEDGTIYVADTMNHVIRRIDPNGNVTLFAGVPETPGWQDGSLETAQFFEPSGLALSPDGTLYVADAANHSIRQISGGVVTTVAGIPGEFNFNTGYPQGGYTNGENSIARFNFPRDVSLMEDGSIAVADSMNHAVRLIGEDKTITLVGSGMADQNYDSVENLRLTRPEGIYANGEILYISDTLNNRVLAVPLTSRVLEGRPSRNEMLETTGLTTTSRYAYGGEIRVFIDDERVDMGRVQPWNTHDSIYVPIRPLLEALGAKVVLNERTQQLIVTVQEQDTVLMLNEDYFILRGIAVTTLEEIVRLFPYTLEWFPEFSLITLSIPSDLREGAMRGGPR